MPSSVVEHLSRGKFGFLHPDPAEIRRIIPLADEILPDPQLIFLDDEDATPLVGFPILVGRSLRSLDEALAEYLAAEENAQFAYLTREAFDSRAYAQSWERYRTLIARALDNVTLASHGGNYPAIFWLLHSGAVSRQLQEIPRRLRRQDLQRGRDHGDVVKYLVYQKWVDRVVNLNYDVAQRFAAEMDEGEQALFPGLLSLMRDNVLIFTEDYVSPDLTELASYFQGYLKLDGRDLRHRLGALEEWHRKILAGDGVLRSAVTSLLGAAADDDAWSLLTRSGYVTYLSSHVTYSSTQLLTPEQIKVWEGLLGKLKEFEVLRALRRMVVQLEEEDGALVSRDRSLSTTWIAGPSVLRVSHATRPIDFMSSWVVDPVVHRYGLVYDITDFSATLSQLGRAEKMALENAFRMTSNFQRRVNRLASSLHLRLEKYLGDGAFYSGRHGRRLLVVAIHLQRLYPEFLARGFPFDSGLRIALNYGEYRLLPLADGPGAHDIRYEFFGHGVVELSRLSTGKKTQEIDDFKTYLITLGYPEHAVNTFFAPMMRGSHDTVSQRDPARRFYAYINPTGALINEGIVATEAFIARLGVFPKLSYLRDGGHLYIVLTLDDEAGGGPLQVGVRKLGVGKFKGLEPIPVYEIVDGGHWRPESLREIPTQKLMSALERLFAETVTAKHRARKPQPV